MDGKERKKSVFDDLEKEMKDHLADANPFDASSAMTDSAEAGGKIRKLCIEFYESDDDEDEQFDIFKKEIEAYKSEPQLETAWSGGESGRKNIQIGCVLLGKELVFKLFQLISCKNVKISTQEVSVSPCHFNSSREDFLCTGSSSN